MKKFYSLLSVAVAATLSAAAIAPQQVNVASAKDATVAGDFVQTEVTSAKGIKLQRQDKRQGKPTKVEDLLGVYDLTYTKWLLSNEDQYGGHLAPQIVAGETPNEVQILGLPYSDIAVPAIVDFEAGTITAKPFETDQYNSSYGEYIRFVAFNVVLNEEDNKYYWREQGDFVLNITEDGLDGTTSGVGYRITDGYFAAFGGITMATPNYFTFNESEWTNIGKVTFEEKLMNNFFKTEYQVAPVQVDAYAQDSLVCVRNPYLTGGWADLNASVKRNDGFILFNIEDPRVVTMPYYTPSGFWVEWDEEGNIEETYIYNMEGAYLAQGWYLEDIYYEFVGNEMPISNYNESTGKVELVNLYFGSTSAPTSSFWFGEDAEQYINVTLDMSGINDVAVDANAPVKYFNLQGVEVANPEKGQLVIKTQGGKAQKVIVK